MYMQWVYFTLTSLNVQYRITNATIDWGKWYVESRDEEISSDAIRRLVFSPNVTARFGACGRDVSPSGTEGGFTISAETGANKMEKVLDVYFSVPWTRKGGTLTHWWSKEADHFCYVGSFDCNIRLGDVRIVCGKIVH